MMEFYNELNEIIKRKYAPHSNNYFAFWKLAALHELCSAIAHNYRAPLSTGSPRLMSQILMGSQNNLSDSKDG